MTVAEGDAVFPQTPWRAKLRAIVERPLFQRTVITMICLNAIVLGIETFPEVSHDAPLMVGIDRAFVAFFLAELIIRLLAYGTRFFRSGWNVADFVIIVGSALGTSNLFAALRAFRIIRVLRVITAIPRMRTVVKALFDAVPGIASVGVIALIVIYVFAVIASSLYGGTHPDYFGDVFTAMYTLFQVITLEGWRDIADAVGEEHRFAWLFFITFVLVGTFTLLNLFIAIVVRVVEEESEDTETLISAETVEILNRLDALSAKVDALARRDVDPPARPD